MKYGKEGKHYNCRDYLLEDLIYADVHRDGRTYYQHKDDGPCEEDFAYLFTWDSFPMKGESILELGCGDGFTTGKDLGGESGEESPGRNQGQVSALLEPLELPWPQGPTYPTSFRECAI